MYGVSPLMIYAIQKRLALLGKNNFELNSLPTGVPFRVGSDVIIVKYACWYKIMQRYKRKSSVFCRRGKIKNLIKV